MNAREKLDEYAEINGINKNQLIGWSIVSDFAEWYVEQVKKCSIPAVVGQSEQFKCHSCGTNHSGKNDDQLFEICQDCFNSI